MALQARSMLLWGLAVRADNQNLPFKAASLGPQINATLRVGYYSLTSLIAEIQAAMNLADPANTYTVSVNRTVNGGTENRITISTNGAFLSLLFATGTTASTSCRDLISFGIFDYTGSTSYTNGASSGETLTTEWYGFNYQPPQVNKKNFGNVNVSTSGEKESITWSVQRFIGVEFKYEPQAKVLVDWQSWIDWVIQQKPFDFTPEISSPSTVYDVTLEKSSEDGKGLAFNMREQVPQYPFRYMTGPMTFRVRSGG